jgi:Tol biopolymer transport system component
MAIVPGTRFGPHEVLSLTGAGGMGEVYRARDTRLDRTVAIKVLPSDLASDSERRQRFEREARAISSLNHPHICTLHDIGHQDGLDYLVLEYLDGETLQQRLVKGALPLREALEIAIHVADALDKAHRAGIVHRDLKPGNIMLTRSGPKLMDFGLAKPNKIAVGAANSALATMTQSAPLTAEGTIMGTFQYMAPEQIEGREADVRSDVFAFGAVLYEMVTGKPAFAGRTTASVIAAVLASEPQAITALQPLSPLALQDVVDACLCKDPEERLQTAHDLKLQLRSVATSASGAHASAAARPFRFRQQWIWALAGAALVSVGLLAVKAFQPLPLAAGLIRAAIEPPPNAAFVLTSDVAGPPTLSPDGHAIAYAASDKGGNRMLWVQQLNATSPQPLAGTSNATFPFWSADSQSVGFFSGSKLMRVEASGGQPITICNSGDGRGGAWSKDDVIVFESTFQGPLLRVPASGGVPVAVTQLGQNQDSHRWPNFMPDGKHFIYLAINHEASKAENNALYWASLDGKENKLVLRTQANATYASGFLLYRKDSSLVAQPFDPAAGELSGHSAILAEPVEYDATTWQAVFTASQAGVVAYQSGNSIVGTKLRWLNSTGNEIGSVGQPGLYRDVRLSRDGRWLAVGQGDPEDIWVYDLGRGGVGTRLTFGAWNEFRPAWSPDGRQLAFTADDNKGHKAIYIKDANGAGSERLLQQSTADQMVVDWSPDGRFLLYEQQRPDVPGSVKMISDMWALPIRGDGKPFLVARSNGTSMFGRFSPDGRWVAYMSDESGVSQIYLTRFLPDQKPGSNIDIPGGKWQVSSEVSERGFPIWRGDGRELYFAAPVNHVLAVPINPKGESIEIGRERILFTANFSFSPVGVPYDVSPDGKKFIVSAAQQASPNPITLLVNWTSGLRK